MWAQLWREKWGDPDESNFKDLEDESLESRLRRSYEKREERKRKRAIDRRRDRWRKLEWEISKNGNPYTIHEHFHVVTFWRNEAWTVFIRNTYNEDKMYSRKSYDTLDAARDAAFDLLLVMEARSMCASPGLVTRVNGEPQHD
jgi:hypothetical protein